MQYEDLNDNEKKERKRLYELSKPLGMHNQPERLNPEDNYFVEFGCSTPIRFNTSEGIKRMEPGKPYDENLNEIIVCDSLNSTNK